MLGYFVGPRFAFGRGALEQLSALGAERPAVVVDPALAADARVHRLVEELGKREVAVATVVPPDPRPTPAAAEALAVRLAERGPDWIVAVGGGTTLDLAKAAWLRFERPDLPLAAVTPLVEPGLRRRARFVAVATTSGAGADSAGSALLWAEDGSPVRPTSRELVPDWSLLDPALAVGVPPPAAADAAAIALGHALEAGLSAWTNPISEALAREALGQLLRTLPRLARDPDDLELRGVVHPAASLAGLAAANAQDGAAAALAEAAAPLLKLPYGRCLAIGLPVLLEFDFPAARDAFRAFAPSFGLGAIEHRSEAAQRVRAVLDALGAPRTFAAAGISEEAFRAALPEIAARAARSPSALANPRIPSAAEWTRLLERAYSGGAVDF